MTKLIGVGGGIASGKSTVGVIGKDMHFDIIETSEILTDELEKDGFPTSDRVMRIAKAHELTNKHGTRILGELAAQKIKTMGLTRVMICGLRHPAQIEALKDHFKTAMCIYIDIDPAIQLQRAIARGAINDPNEIKQLQKLIEDEASPDGNISVHLPGTKAICDHVVTNNTLSIESFTNVIRGILSK